jgi:hypothetical protein
LNSILNQEAMEMLYKVIIKNFMAGFDSLKYVSEKKKFKIKFPPHSEHKMSPSK